MEIIILLFFTLMAMTSEGRELFKLGLGKAKQFMGSISSGKIGIKQDPLQKLEKNLNKLQDKKEELINNKSEKQAKLERIQQKLEEVGAKIENKQEHASNLKSAGEEERAKEELELVIQLQNQQQELQNLYSALESGIEEYVQTIENIDRTYDQFQTKLETLKIRQDISGAEGDNIDTNMTQGVQKLIEEAEDKLRTKEFSNDNKRKHYQLPEKGSSKVKNEQVEELFQNLSTN